MNRTIFTPKDVTCQVGMHGAYIMFDLEFKTSIQGDLEKALGNSQNNSIFLDSEAELGASHNSRQRYSKSFVIGSSIPK